MFNLNRASNLLMDDETPDIVLTDLLSTCRKKVTPALLKERRNDVIKFITNYDGEIDPVSPDMIKIANYVSPKNQTWESFNLWKAFLHLDMFEPKLIKISKSDLGDKTNLRPLSYDSIMLYKIMQENSINTDKDDTIFTMMDKINQKFDESMEKIPIPVAEPETRTVEVIKEVPVEVIKEVPVEVIKEVEVENTNIPVPDYFDQKNGIEKIMNELKVQDKDTIWKMFNLLQKESEKYDFSTSSHSDNKEILKKINLFGLTCNSCFSPQEAIIYGFKNFSIDLTESDIPVVELKKFCEMKLEGKKYRPVNTEFREKYALNRIWYNTDKTYKKYFSKLYSQKTSSKLIQYNGGEEEDTLDFFKDIEDENTFFKGIPPVEGYSENVISFVDNADLGKEDTIISYGPISPSSNSKYIFFTPNELKEYFEKQKDFSDFFDKNLQIPYHAIVRLQNICNDSHSSSDIGPLLERIGFFLDTGKPYFPLLKEILSQYLVYQKELESIFKTIYRNPSFDIEKIKELIPRIMKEQFYSLPLLVNGPERKRLFRSKEKLLGIGNKEEDVKLSAKFYYENMTSEKID